MNLECLTMEKVLKIQIMILVERGKLILFK